ncbi:MAG: hypothetical protein Q8Q20_00325 [bacterium]|nr:hypothetical protein [bacterium]
MEKGKTILAIKISLVALLAALFLWIAERNIAFDGSITLRWTPNASASISDLDPSARVGSREKDLDYGFVYRRIHTDPVYFDVAMPRSFTSATLTLEYANEGQPQVELGIQRSANEWDFLMKPIEHRYLDVPEWWKLHDESTGYTVVEVPPVPEADETLPERVPTPTFTSVDEFLNAIGPEDRIAQYFTDVKKYIQDPDYVSAGESVSTDTALRGRHVFYTYIKDETLEITASFQDINRAFGPDRFHLNVYRGDSELVASSTVEDDGVIGASGQGSAARAASISQNDLPEGIYRIEFDISDDLIIRDIQSSAHSFVASGSVFPVTNANYSPAIGDLSPAANVIWTSSSALTFLTPHEEGFQEISVDGQPIRINELSQNYFWEAGVGQENQLHRVELPLSDVQISGNGFFAFSEASFFEPAPNILPLRHNTDDNDFQFIVARDYTSPEILPDRWKKATQMFDLTQAYTEDNRLRFLISAPGISERPGTIKLRKITVELNRQPFSLSSVKDQIQNFLEKR